MTPRHPYAGRIAVLATIHGKERAFGPALHTALGLHVRVSPGIDTDALGTFTGEVRCSSPISGIIGCASAGAMRPSARCMRRYSGFASSRCS
jgi:hypothetical protein